MILPLEGDCFFDEFFIKFRSVSRTPLFSSFWATKVPVYPQLLSKICLPLTQLRFPILAGARRVETGLVREGCLETLESSEGVARGKIQNFPKLPTEGLADSFL